MKKILSVLLLTFVATLSFAQALKMEAKTAEIESIRKVFVEISESDQLYRTPLFYNTLDRKTIQELDSIYDHIGIKAGMKYQKSLNLKLDKPVEDSLRQLQIQLDFRNHMLMRGIWERYGWIPDSLIPDNKGVQIVLLLHPPYDVEGVAVYLEEYKELLLPEVRSGRMPAKSYATFVDNMRKKILGMTQLYGTGHEFDTKTNSVAPAGIVDLKKTNEARAAIGLPALKEGEYRIVSE